MSNNSASGGYLTPTTAAQFPGGQTLNQFIQTVLVGISGLPGPQVRPSWQVAPPDQPDITVNWLAFGIEITNPDTFVFSEQNPDGSYSLQRQQKIEIKCSFYGPDAADNASILQDGFQIPQNCEVLELHNMGFAYSEDAMNLPDLVNERWIPRVVMSVFLRRQIERTYAVLELLSAQGTIHTEIKDAEGHEYDLPFSVEEPES